MSYLNGEMLQSLQKLLQPENQDDDYEQIDQPASSTYKMGPAHINAPPANRNVTPWRNDAAAQTPKTETQLQSPASLDELERFDEEARHSDKQLPEYRYIYRQAVGTEDLFFHLNNRNPSTASCEDIILEIVLTGDDTPSHQMRLNITEESIKLDTNKYHLHLPLVQKINVQRTSAHYDTVKKTLRIKMRAVRELDICNF